MNRQQQIAVLAVAIAIAAYVGYLFVVRPQLQQITQSEAPPAPAEQPNGQTNPRDDDPLGTVKGVTEKP